MVDLVAVRADDLPRPNLLSAMLAGVTDADRLAEAGEWIVDCATTADFLAHVSRAGVP